MTREDDPADRRSAPEAGRPAADRVPTTIVGSALRVLAAVAAVGAFGHWVWFVVTSFGRLWARVSSFGPGPGRATKLEVAWALLGWAIGPVFAAFAVLFLASLADGLAPRRTGRGPPG